MKHLTLLIAICSHLALSHQEQKLTSHERKWA